jgi:uncharacterized spore protein YtfJ
VSDETSLRTSNPGRTVVGTGTSTPDPATLLKETVAELSRVLDPKQVIGEPMAFGNVTVIPLVSVGFGFGAGGGGGGGNDAKGDAGEGGGGGGAAGVGIKPIAVIIVDENGARLEPIPERPSGFEKLGTAIANTLETRNEAKAKKG